MHEGKVVDTEEFRTSVQISVSFRPLREGCERWDSGGAICMARAVKLRAEALGGGHKIDRLAASIEAEVK